MKSRKANVYEELDQIGLGLENLDSIHNAENEDLIVLTQIISESLPATEDTKLEDSPFNFTANLNMSGGIGYCQEYECRMPVAWELAYNAALYADHICLLNPFERYLGYQNFSESSKNDLINDLLILFSYKPLYEAGLVSYCNPTTHFCEDCYAEFIATFRKGLSNDFEKLESDVINLVSEKVIFEVFDDGGKPSLKVNNLDGIVDHPVIYLFDEIPELIQEKYKPGGSIQLTPHEIKTSGAHFLLSKRILTDFAYQDYYSQLNKTNILTNREIDFDLQNLGNGHSAELRPLFKKLSHEIPFISDSNINKLIKLRKNEGEAFKTYQDAFSSALKTVKTLSGNEVEELYLDTIRPELNKIQLTIMNSKRLLWGDIKRDVVIGSSFVAAGLSAGFVPDNIGQIVSAVGGIKYAGQLAKNIQGLITEPQTIKENPYYFLWKVKRHSS